MLRKVSLVLLLAATVRTACAVVDLTPAPSEYTAEGITFSRLTFRDGDKRISYEPPLRWTYQGSPRQLMIAPRDKPFAEGTLEVTSPYKPQPFTPELQEILTRQVLAALPPDSLAVEVKSRGENTVVFNNLPNFEVVVSYKRLGETFERSVVFADAADTRFTFRFTARASEFSQLHGAYRRSLCTWRVEEMAPGTAAQ
jgi:hypothetical protein